MSERWKPIPSHPGYEASDLGRIRSYIVPGRLNSKRATEPKILNPSTNRGGYQLVRPQGRQRRFVHRLVMEAFVGPAPHGIEVDHLDNNPRNNSLSNLRYVTPAENYAARYARRVKFNCGHPVSGNEYWDGKTRTCHQCKRKSWREARQRARSRAKGATS